MSFRLKVMTSRILTLLALSITAALPARAANITQVKNNKVLIDSVGADEMHAGDEFYALTSDGKKRGVITITQVKGKKALGEITKGNPEVGLELQLKSGGPSMSRDVRESDLDENDRSSTSSAYYKRLHKKFDGNAWGLLGEMLQMNMSAAFTADAGTSKRSVTADMKGNAFGVMGFYDYPLAQQFQLRGYGGLEQFSASGTLSNADCDQGKSATCTFSVTYFSMYGAAKYNFYDQGRTRYYAEAGYGFLVATSKASNVISTSQISTNQVFFGGVGAEIPLGRNSFIPIAVDYGAFPPSDTVKASLLVIRAGYAWAL